MDPVKLLGWTEVLLRLGAAVAIGALLGLNRELRGKPAGLRTNALVALGAALMTLGGIGIGTGTELLHGTDGNAVSRIVQGIVTGVGFVGAGLIIRDDSGRKVHGLTTAATLWVSAALGILCGAGVWSAAIAGTCFTLLVLVLGGPFERFVHGCFPAPPDGNGDAKPPR